MLKESKAVCGNTGHSVKRIYSPCTSVAKKNSLSLAGAATLKPMAQILSVKLNLQKQMLSIFYLYRYEIHPLHPFSGFAVYFLLQKRSS
jgi:hypothetical protein